jgi:acyl-CoA reductase-like NAD-dependent aldehyde dehydrogenase
MPAAGLQARLGILQAAAELVDRRAVELADLIVSEVAKPIRYARGEVARTAALFRAVARRVSEAELEIREAEALVRYRPLGTVAAITPWNNPLAIAAGQLAPAFAYGNAIVWKPAPAGNRCGAALHRLLLEAGVEPEALLMLTGAGDVGLALARQRGIDAVCFTGATSTGRMLAALCGDRNLPVQAELGGNNAAIVTAEADLDRAALLVAEAAFGSAGQRCTATRRVILLPDVYDRFSDLLEASTARLSWGDPQAEETHVGPLINDEHAARVAAVVARAAAAGHRIVQPHLADAAKAVDPPFYPPTIVFCDDPRAEIVQEETFGPVLVVQRARDLADAFALQNGVRQGLAAALFSNSADEQQAFLATARAGILKLNQATVEAGVDVPFLGWKDSGIGPPQHGAANRIFFTRAQAVYGDAV